MAEAPQTPPAADPGQSQANPPRLMIQTQFVRDLSFENPRAPASLQAGGQRPEISVRIDVRAQPMEEDRYEVTLQLNVEGKAGGETTFVLELSYAGIFVLMNIPRDATQAILLIECPRLLFPFVRRVVADTTRDGGFPPLMIDPVDFAALYRRRQQQQQQQAGAGQPLENPTVGNGSPS
jgi:preprotein translocase subunit SecB